MCIRDRDTPDLIVQAAAEENPMGRNATPADVVPAMAFLLSDEARSVSYTHLDVYKRQDLQHAGTDRAEAHDSNFSHWNFPPVFLHSVSVREAAL